MFTDVQKNITIETEIKLKNNLFMEIVYKLYMYIVC